MVSYFRFRNLDVRPRRRNARPERPKIGGSARLPIVKGVRRKSWRSKWRLRPNRGCNKISRPW